MNSIRKVAIVNHANVVNLMLAEGWMLLCIVEGAGPGGYPVWVLGTSDKDAEMIGEAAALTGNASM